MILYHKRRWDSMLVLRKKNDQCVKDPEKIHRCDCCQSTLSYYFANSLQASKHSDERISPFC